MLWKTLWRFFKKYDPLLFKNYFVFVCAESSFLCKGFPLVAGSGGYSLVALCGRLIVTASLVVLPRL